MRTPAKQRRNPSVHSISLVPALAAAAPHKRLVYLVGVACESLDLVKFRVHTSDVFGGHFINPFRKVVSRPVQRFNQRAMTAQAIWPHHHEVIRNVRCSDGDVRLGVINPEFRKVCTVATHYGEARTVRDVEAGCAYDYRELVSDVVIIGEPENISLTY